MATATQITMSIGVPPRVFPPSYPSFNALNTAHQSIGIPLRSRNRRLLAILSFGLSFACSLVAVAMSQGDADVVSALTGMGMPVSVDKAI